MEKRSENGCEAALGVSRLSPSVAPPEGSEAGSVNGFGASFCNGDGKLDKPQSEGRSLRERACRLSRHLSDQEDKQSVCAPDASFTSSAPAAASVSKAGDSGGHGVVPEGACGGAANMRDRPDDNVGALLRSSSEKKGLSLPAHGLAASAFPAPHYASTSSPSSAVGGSRLKVSLSSSQVAASPSAGRRPHTALSSVSVSRRGVCTSMGACFEPAATADAARGSEWLLHSRDRALSLEFARGWPAAQSRRAGEDAQTPWTSRSSWRSHDLHPVASASRRREWAVTPEARPFSRALSSGLGSGTLASTPAEGGDDRRASRAREKCNRSVSASTAPVASQGAHVLAGSGGETASARLRLSRDDKRCQERAEEEGARCVSSPAGTSFSHSLSSSSRDFNTSRGETGCLYHTLSLASPPQMASVRNTSPRETVFTPEGPGPPRTGHAGRGFYQGHRRKGEAGLTSPGGQATSPSSQLLGKIDAAYRAVKNWVEDSFLVDINRALLYPAPSPQSTEKAGKSREEAAANRPASLRKTERRTRRGPFSIPAYDESTALTLSPSVGLSPAYAGSSGVSVHGRDRGDGSAWRQLRAGDEEGRTPSPFLLASRRRGPEASPIGLDAAGGISGSLSPQTDSQRRREAATPHSLSLDSLRGNRQTAPKYAAEKGRGRHSVSCFDQKRAHTWRLGDVEFENVESAAEQDNRHEGEAEAEQEDTAGASSLTRPCPRGSMETHTFLSHGWGQPEHTGDEGGKAERKGASTHKQQVGLPPGSEDPHVLREQVVDLWRRTERDNNLFAADGLSLEAKSLKEPLPGPRRLWRSKTESAVASWEPEEGLCVANGGDTHSAALDACPRTRGPRPARRPKASWPGSSQAEEAERDLRLNTRVFSRLLSRVSVSLPRNFGRRLRWRERRARANSDARTDSEAGEWTGADRDHVTRHAARQSPPRSPKTHDPLTADPQPSVRDSPGEITAEAEETDPDAWRLAKNTAAARAPPEDDRSNSSNAWAAVAAFSSLPGRRRDRGPYLGVRGFRRAASVSSLTSTRKAELPPDSIETDYISSPVIPLTPSCQFTPGKSLAHSSCTSFHRGVSSTPSGGPEALAGPSPFSEASADRQKSRMPTPLLSSSASRQSHLSPFPSPSALPSSSVPRHVDRSAAASEACDPLGLRPDFAVSCVHLENDVMGGQRPLAASAPQNELKRLSLSSSPPEFLFYLRRKPALEFEDPSVEKAYGLYLAKMRRPRLVAIGLVLILLNMMYDIPEYMSSFHQERGRDPTEAHDSKSYERSPLLGVTPPFARTVKPYETGIATTDGQEPEGDGAASTGSLPPASASVLRHAGTSMADQRRNADGIEDRRYDKSWTSGTSANAENEHKEPIRESPDGSEGRPGRKPELQESSGTYGRRFLQEKFRNAKRRLADLDLETESTKPANDAWSRKARLNIPQHHPYRRLSGYSLEEGDGRETANIAAVEPSEFVPKRSGAPSIAQRNRDSWPRRLSSLASLPRADWARSSAAEVATQELPARSAFAYPFSPRMASLWISFDVVELTFQLGVTFASHLPFLKTHTEKCISVALTSVTFLSSLKPVLILGREAYLRRQGEGHSLSADAGLSAGRASEGTGKLDALTGEAYLLSLQTCLTAVFLRAIVGCVFVDLVGLVRRHQLLHLHKLLSLLLLALLLLFTFVGAYCLHLPSALFCYAWCLGATSWLVVASCAMGSSLSELMHRKTFYSVVSVGSYRGSPVAGKPDEEDRGDLLPLFSGKTVLEQLTELVKTMEATLAQVDMCRLDNHTCSAFAHIHSLQTKCLDILTSGRDVYAVKWDTQTVPREIHVLCSQHLEHSYTQVTANVLTSSSGAFSSPEAAGASAGLEEESRDGEDDSDFNKEGNKRNEGSEDCSGDNLEAGYWRGRAQKGRDGDSSGAAPKDREPAEKERGDCGEQHDAGQQRGAGAADLKAVTKRESACVKRNTEREDATSRDKTHERCEQHWRSPKCFQEETKTLRLPSGQTRQGDGRRPQTPAFSCSPPCRLAIVVDIPASIHSPSSLRQDLSYSRRQSSSQGGRHETARQLVRFSSFASPSSLERRTLTRQNTEKLELDGRGKTHNVAESAPSLTGSRALKQDTAVVPGGCEASNSALDIRERHLSNRRPSSPSKEAGQRNKASGCSNEEGDTTGVGDTFAAAFSREDSTDWLRESPRKRTPITGGNQECDQAEAPPTETEGNPGLPFPSYPPLSPPLRPVLLPFPLASKGSTRAYTQDESSCGHACRKRSNETEPELAAPSPFHAARKGEKKDTGSERVREGDEHRDKGVKLPDSPHASQFLYFSSDSSTSGRARGNEQLTRLRSPRIVEKGNILTSYVATRSSTASDSHGKATQPGGRGDGEAVASDDSRESQAIHRRLLGRMSLPPDAGDVGAAKRSSNGEMDIERRDRRREKVQVDQRAAKFNPGDERCLDDLLRRPKVAAGLASVGLTWTLDLFSLDALSDGNILVAVGLHLLLPHWEKGRLRCSAADLGLFLQNLQSLYLPNVYHNRVHAAMVAHLALFLSRAAGLSRWPSRRSSALSMREGSRAGAPMRISPESSDSKEPRAGICSVYSAPSAPSLTSSPASGLKPECALSCLGGRTDIMHASRNTHVSLMSSPCISLSSPACDSATPHRSRPTGRRPPDPLSARSCSHFESAHSPACLLHPGTPLDKRGALLPPDSVVSRGDSDGTRRFASSLLHSRSFPCSCARSYSPMDASPSRRSTRGGEDRNRERESKGVRADEARGAGDRRGRTWREAETAAACDDSPSKELSAGGKCWQRPEEPPPRERWASSPGEKQRRRSTALLSPKRSTGTSDERAKTGDHAEKAAPTRMLDDEIILCLAALGHDVGHPGYNNAFLVATNQPIALVYDDNAVLENYHAYITFRTLTSFYSSEANDRVSGRGGEGSVLRGITPGEYRYFRKHLIELILATDMSQHFSTISAVRVRRENPSFNFTKNEEDRWLMMKMCMKIGDIGHAALEWEQHYVWSMRVTEEFLLQGDAELKAGLPVSPLCDRNAPETDLHRSQSSFINYLVVPLIKELVACLDTHPWNPPRSNSSHAKATLTEKSTEKHSLLNAMDTADSSQCSVVRSSLRPESSTSATRSRRCCHPYRRISLSPHHYYWGEGVDKGQDARTPTVELFACVSPAELVRKAVLSPALRNAERWLSRVRSCEEGTEKKAGAPGATTNRDSRHEGQSPGLKKKEEVGEDQSCKPQRLLSLSPFSSAHSQRLSPGCQTPAAGTNPALLSTPMQHSRRLLRLKTYSPALFRGRDEETEREWRGTLRRDYGEGQPTAEDETGKKRGEQDTAGNPARRRSCMTVQENKRRKQKEEEQRQERTRGREFLFKGFLKGGDKITEHPTLKHGLPRTSAHNGAQHSESRECRDEADNVILAKTQSADKGCSPGLEGNNEGANGGRTADGGRRLHVDASAAQREHDGQEGSEHLVAVASV
ncbi:3'5'-cyclic nucleotide phosphodiesterase domain-containing protein [Besnoitia besnoiti]|uniref:Phosphodiesterase n=1 Tax=Besnoitia besnoiti TaxID=94643 RepID=A0A2A9MAT0_BESBE|nr:3'5'-cyclic nucleotide phosphodiesterase domain-containing protein [Besnoitia besnoiti]PFH35095.1 3'5'-cyclic nucleotide phosphodiesterase domain-containing protein [Besnoitia besnoiti]